MAVILEGKKIAQDIRSTLRQQVELLDRVPELAVILVGDDPGSQIYVRNKKLVCEEIGIKFRLIELPAGVLADELENTIISLNQDEVLDGIVLQTPLPSHLAVQQFTGLIDPDKDVDGLNPINMGKLYTAKLPDGLSEVLVPATAQAVLRLIEESGVGLVGKKAVVVGRSLLVGKPVAQLLLMHDVSVTVCHSQTIDLAEQTRQADILVVAAGKPGLITADYVKKGAIVIDVGINRVKGKVVGDVSFEEVVDKVGWISPVPKGVGPLTVAYLLKNVLQAFIKRI